MRPEGYDNRFALSLQGDLVKTLKDLLMPDMHSVECAACYDSTIQTHKILNAMIDLHETMLCTKVNSSCRVGQRQYRLYRWPVQECMDLFACGIGHSNAHQRQVLHHSPAQYCEC